jgi:hypothetical protein
VSVKRVFTEFKDGKDYQESGNKRIRESVCDPACA